jgi:hypothetical protein
LEVPKPHRTSASTSDSATTSQAFSHSEIRFGNVTVGTNPVSGSNAAVFNTTGNPRGFYYDQVALRVGMSHPTYEFRMDFAISGLIGTRNQFSIHFDTPSAQTLVFRPDGKIEASTGVAPGISKRVIGDYVQTTGISLAIIANTQASQWQVILNDNVLDTGLFSSSGGQLGLVRLSLGNRSSLDPQDGRTSVFVDSVYFAVPEPSTLVLAGAWSLLLCCRRRRIRGR